MSERYQPAEVVRRGQATLGDFISLLTSMPRDLARLIKDARHGCMRVDLDLKRLDSLGDRRDNPKRPRQLSALAGLSFVLRWRGPTGRGGSFEQAGIAKSALLTVMDLDFANVVINFALWRDPEPVREVIADVICQLQAKGYSAEEVGAAIDELVDELNGHGQPRH